MLGRLVQKNVAALIRSITVFLLLNIDSTSCEVNARPLARSYEPLLVADWLIPVQPLMPGICIVACCLSCGKQFHSLVLQIRNSAAKPKLLTFCTSQAGSPTGSHVWGHVI